MATRHKLTMASSKRVLPLRAPAPLGHQRPRRERTSNRSLLVGAALGLGACVLGSADARAAGEPSIYDNHQLYLIGSRAAGMGGAYTALACDEAALHYNPAGLACASHSRLELVANAYMIQSYGVPRALGEGQDISASTYHSIPSVVGGVYVTSDGDAETRQGRQAFAFSVSVPYSLALKAAPTSPDTRNFLSGSWRDDVLAADVGYGYQVLPSLAVGLSLGGMVRILSASTNFLVTRPIAAGGAEFLAASTETEALALGLRAKLGVRWTPSTSWAFGLNVTTPTLDPYGSYSVSNNYALAGFDQTGRPLLDATPIRFTGKSAASFPMRVALGAAYLGNGYTLSADASLNLPHSIRVAYDLVPIRIQGVTESSPAPVTLERVLQPNINVGAELHVTRTIAIDLGGFTDLSSVPASTATEDRIHMFGVSAALSLLGVQTNGSFGASFSYGVAETQVQTGQFSLDTILSAQRGTSTLTRWNLVGVIGSNYSFLPDDVAAKAGEHPKAPTPAR